MTEFETKPLEFINKFIFYVNVRETTQNHTELQKSDIRALVFLINICLEHLFAVKRVFQLIGPNPVLPLFLPSLCTHDLSKRSCLFSLPFFDFLRAFSGSMSTAGESIYTVSLFKLIIYYL